MNVDFQEQQSMAGEKRMISLDGPLRLYELLKSPSFSFVTTSTYQHHLRPVSLFKDQLQVSDT